MLKGYIMTRKRLLVVITLIITVFLTFIIVKLNNIILIVTNEDKPLDYVLQEKVGDYYFRIYDYKYLSLGCLKILKYQDKIDTEEPVFDGTDKEKFYKCFDVMKSLSYNLGQSNPNLVVSKGGNCQALSLQFDYMLKINNIKCDLEGTVTHMYNKVYIDNNVYKVDITNKTIEKVCD